MTSKVTIDQLLDYAERNLQPCDSCGRLVDFTAQFVFCRQCVEAGKASMYFNRVLVKEASHDQQ